MFTLITILALSPVQPAAADTVFLNGRIWTGNDKQPEAIALAVRAGKIVAVGTDDEIKPLIGPNTKSIDLTNRRVVPGFHDSHLHFVGGGRSLNQVDLKLSRNEAEFGKLLADFDKNTSKSRWLLGGNWDHDRTFAGKLPTAAMLDAFVKDRPVFIRRYDGHMALANTAALLLAGIDANTKDAAGGVIERLADGKTPSGVLKDNAMNLVEKIIPEPDREEIAQAIKAAMTALATNGITSAQDMEGSSAATRKVYRDLILMEEMRRTMTARLDLHRPIGEYVKLDGVATYKSDFLSDRSLKGFMDGSLGSSTAKMAEPYLNSMTTGVYVTEPGVMKNLVTKADAAKYPLPIHIHAIGDEANSQLLDIFKHAAATNGPRDRRFRIEHAQHLKPEDIKRFKELNVIASMQPYHVIDDGRWAEGRIGAKRCESSYAYRALLDSGAVLAFGSDWPVAPLNVLEGIDAAVNRRPLDGKHLGGWFPKQKITVSEAVKAYTAGSAYASFHEKDNGTLEPGKFADLVVLDSDIFDAKNGDAIAKTKVDLTVVNGNVVFDRMKSK